MSGLAQRLHRHERYVITGLAAALTFVTCLRQISDPDYWTHLALARAYVKSGSFRIVEPFLQLPVSRLPSGAHPAFALPESWPFQLLVYAVRSVSSDAAVSVLVAGLAAAMFALVAAAVPCPIGWPRQAIALVLVVGILWVARFRLVARPELTSYVALAAALHMVQRWLARPRAALLAALAMLIAVWTQLHVSWAIGIGFVVLHLALLPDRAFWRTRIAASPRWTLGLGLAAAAFALAVAVRFAALVARSLFSGQTLHVLEMQPTWRFPGVFLPFAAVVALALVLAWGDRAGRTRRIALLVPAVALGSIVVRNVAFAVVCLTPAAFAGLARWPAPGIARWTRLLPPVTAAAAAIALVVKSTSDPGEEWGVGILPGSVPRDAAEFVVRAGLPEPVFNSFDFGGYLDFAWGGRPHTFLDGRLYPPARVADHAALTRLEDPEGVLARNGFRTVVLKPLYDHYGSLVPAVGWLLEQREWSLVRATDALVFVREPLPPGVHRLPRSAAWRQVLESARGSHGAYTASFALLQLGDWSAAARAFAEAVQQNPEAVGQYADLGQTLGFGTAAHLAPDMRENGGR